MPTLLSDESLIDFLESEAADLPPQIGATGNGLCLLVGARAMRNLREGLVRRELEPKQISEYETIQSVSRQVLGRRYPGEPRVLSQRVRERLIRDVVNDALNGETPPALQTLVSTAGDTWDDELYETLEAELEQYWRSTDGGADHGILADATATLDDPYARYRNQRALSGFAALSAILEERTESLPQELFLSESHLTREARDVLADGWAGEYGNIDWVAVGTIKNVDNGLLRFFRELDDLDDGPELYFSFGEGSQSRVLERFRRIGMDVAERSLERSSNSPVSDELVDVASEGSRRDSPPDGVRFVDAPDRRREVETVARDIASEVQAGNTSLGEYLLVIRETSEYEAIIDDVFTTHGIPFHVESDWPMAQVVAYRFLKATVDLIELADSGEQVPYHDIVDPLRLGYCPSTTAPGEWPLDDTSFLELEQRLHTIGSESGNEERSVSSWYDVVQRESAGIAWRQLSYFLSWVIERSNESPGGGDKLAGLLENLCRAHVESVADAPVRQSGGPGVDATRTNLNRKHPTFLAERVANELDGVGRYYEYILDLELSDPGWNLAAQALGDVVGRGQYSASNTDGNAVQVVIPANTYYLSAKHAYVLGAGAGEFPKQQPTSTFLHDDLSQAVEQYTLEGPKEASFLHLPGNEAMYRRELDDYESTVRTPTDGMTICRHARNSEGDNVTWSPFVAPIADGLTEAESEYERIRLSQWLPARTDEADWAAVAADAPMRDRIRLLAYHFGSAGTIDSFVPRLRSNTIRSEEAAIPLLSGVDGGVYRENVVPRRERFLMPAIDITVRDDEPAFHDTPLDDVVGGPVRPHEVDLFGQCQLKYYFYQHLVAREDQTTRRDDWPDEQSPYAKELYPTLPTLLSNHYAPASYRTAVRRLVTEHLPERQADLGQYDDVGSLRADFEEWVDGDDDLDESVFQSLVGEYLTVMQEAAGELDRSWSWQPEESIAVGDYEVLLPGHRTDTVSGVEGLVPVFQSGRHGGALSALKHCWTGSIRGEQASDVCRSCDRHDRCTIPTKHVLDTRVRSSIVAGSAGALVYDRYTSSPSGRRGFLTGEQVETVDHERNVRIQDGPQLGRRERWEGNLETLLDAMTPEDGSVTYGVSEQFVANGGCEGCTFRDLCSVPTRFEENGGESA